MTEDELDMIKEVRQFSRSPVPTLKWWLAENARHIVEGTNPYAVQGTSERRFEVQARLLAMVEDGLLDENLKEVKRESAQGYCTSGDVGEVSGHG